MNESPTAAVSPTTPPTGVDADLARARADLRIRLNRLMELLSDRTDVLVSMIWDRPEITVPAWFDPRRAEITIHGDLALDSAHPDEVDPTTASGRSAHPVVCGLAAHEAGHAQHTRWPASLHEHAPAAVARAATLLEEPRVEARQLSRRPDDRPYLRAASRHLHLSKRPADASEVEDRWRAAKAAALLLARVDAGVLTPEDITDVIPIVTHVLGAGLVGRLRPLWRQALRLEDGDLGGLLDLATKWVTALDIDPDPNPDTAGNRMPGASCATNPTAASNPDGSPDAPSPAADGTDTSGAGGDDDDEAADPLADALREATSIISTTQTAALQDGDRDGHRDPDPARAARLADRAQESTHRAAAQTQAAWVFGHGHSDPAAAAVIAGTRSPTPKERAAVNQLAAALARARFRERGAIVTPSAIPPGRLDGRAAMQRTAEQTLGLQPTAAPFRQVVRRHTDQPNLTVGIGADVSGSMGWAEQPLASAAWIIAHAVYRVGGRSATVAFGDAVTAIVPPGRPPGQVTEFVAKGGTEMVIEAIEALDGALQLATGSGVRLLIVVSDGYFVGPGQRSGSERLVERLRRTGVVVLHVDLGTGTEVIPGATPVVLSDPAASAASIAERAVSALHAAR